MVALQRIQVKGFKSIREMDLELRPLNVLIGANGSGKSNFLSVFSLVFNVLNTHLTDYVKKSGGADYFLHYGKKKTDAIEVKLSNGDSSGYEATLPFISGDTLTVRAEFFGFDSKTSKLREEFMIALMRTYVYHFDDTTDTAKIKSTVQLHDNRFLRPDGANLAAVLYLFRERNRPFYDRIIETIQLVAPFFDDFVLQPLELNPDTILLEWREKGSDAYFNANMLSDGTLRFTCLATLLRQPNPPPLILIDEPELGLHPYAINLLAGMLKAAATKTQVIVTTQSPTLVDLFEPEDIIVVDRENKEATFRRLDRDALKEWLEDYTLSELWQKNVIGGRP